MNQIDEVINELFANNAKKLQKICNKEMMKFGGISNMDYDDFYSRVGWDISIARKRFDPTKGKTFKEYIYGIVKFSVRKEIKHRNREKRQIVVEVEEKDCTGEMKKHKEYVKNLSIDSPIGEEENSTVGDMVADKDTIESLFFGENRGTYSKEMNEYLSKLSVLQQNVLYLISIGFTSNEIIEELHINKKLYEDCYNAIHSYRNISILM